MSPQAPMKPQKEAHLGGVEYLIPCLDRLTAFLGRRRVRFPGNMTPVCCLDGSGVDLRLQVATFSVGASRVRAMEECDRALGGGGGGATPASGP